MSEIYKREAKFSFFLIFLTMCSTLQRFFLQNLECEEPSDQGRELLKQLKPSVAVPAGSLPFGRLNGVCETERKGWVGVETKINTR